MTTAAKALRCAARFSRSRSALLRPAETIQRGLTAQLQRRCISSSGRNGEAAVKVDVENRRMDASNFVNMSGLKPSELDVRNSLAADAMLSPSAGAPLSPFFRLLPSNLETN